jgi:hypothetical protein
VSDVTGVTGVAGDLALLLVLAGLVLPCILVKLLSGNSGRGYNIHSLYLSNFCLQNTHIPGGIHSAILCLLVTLEFLGKQVLSGISWYCTLSPRVPRITCIGCVTVVGLSNACIHTIVTTIGFSGMLWQCAYNYSAALSRAVLINSSSFM